MQEVEQESFISNFGKGLLVGVCFLLLLIFGYQISVYTNDAPEMSVMAQDMDLSPTPELGVVEESL